MGRLFQAEGMWGTRTSEVEGVWSLLSEEGVVCNKTGEVGKTAHVTPCQPQEGM